ncbi:hypothetical protein AMATHDRAFT_67042 [Amanita thiersii Skay4041]|uniref:Uncharacterized protein n=1 Tax=Amanita thiersii Skay4041 TaxID=703135 RepID=A0A2A9NJ30_9AGAR|nr:hypothetical protein AMATHDRAFT_67042 [Amanita thiersii Skay4041]
MPTLSRRPAERMMMRLNAIPMIGKLRALNIRATAAALHEIGESIKKINAKPVVTVNSRPDSAIMCIAKRRVPPEFKHLVSTTTLQIRITIAVVA